MTSRKGEGKEPPHEVLNPLNHSQDSPFAGNGGRKWFLIFKKKCSENGGVQKNLTLGKMKVGSNTQPIVTHYLLQSLNEASLL